MEVGELIIELFDSSPGARSLGLAKSGVEGRRAGARAGFKDAEPIGITGGGGRETDDVGVELEAGRGLCGMLLLLLLTVLVSAGDGCGGEAG